MQAPAHGQEAPPRHGLALSPATASHVEDTLAGAGGLTIFWQAWLPAADPRAVVVLAHGASEHSGRYAWTGERLAERGYALYALDHRGHGRSEGARAVIDRMSRALADIDTLVELAHSRHPGLPLHLLGHSMGGALAIAYALRHQDKLDTLVLSAPAAALETASLFERAAGRVLSAIAPRTGVFEIESAAVSRDPGVVRDYDADPLNHHGKLPARTVKELADEIGGFHDGAPALTLPLLGMHGTGDRITPPAGTEMIVERASSADKRLIEYDGLYHEILNEPERERVLSDIADWLDAHSSR